MLSPKLNAIRIQFEEALKRFEEILKKPQDDVIRDASIKRFEFTFDLAWKYLKVRLEDEKGIVSRSPKDCFRQAYSQKMIPYDDLWIEMTDLRNQAVHIYDRDFAENLYRRLPDVLPKFQELLK